MAAVNYDTYAAYNEPYDYNFTIAVDPDTLYQKYHKALDQHVIDVSRALDEVGKLWKGLRIQWMGPDSDTAQAFMEQLTASLRALYGRDGVPLRDLGPNEGALVKLSTGVNLIAQNFGEAEWHIHAMMSDFADGLLNPAAGGGGPVAGYSVHGEGPVTETKTPLRS